jgi:hypothetical protein
MFAKNDHVVVVGSTLNKDNSKTDFKFEIAKVIEVAKYELIVSPTSTGAWRRDYRVSKKNCHKINLADVKTHSMHPSPKIGDLVLYYSIGYDKVEKQVGILMHIIDNPSGTKIGKIICNNEFSDVAYRDLLILEENNYKKPRN